MATPGMAWGPLGHRVVAEIAEGRLSPAVQTRVRALLEGASLARASTWADDFKFTPEGEATSSWHWMDLEDDEALEERSRRSDRDLLDAVLHFREVLGDPAASPEERTIALRWLVHLVADVHQPLHVGRRGDKGGNSLAVVWLGEETNLHRVWDLHLPAWPRLSYTEWAHFLAAEIPPREAAGWAAAPVEEWVEESRALRGAIYPQTEGEGELPVLGGAYAATHLPSVERRLQQAGVRLAGILERLLAGPSMVPEREVNPPAGSERGEGGSPPG